MTYQSSATGAELNARAGWLWSGLDECWQEAFRQAWEALRAGSIAVGACAAMPDGTIVHAARNRVADRDGPPGEVFGSALAHAEVNVLARLAFRQPRRLALTTTLEPCLQCSAAIRLGPIAGVRFAGADPLWQGCHDFSSLSPREAARSGAVTMTGPCTGEVGLFGTLISRFGPGMVPHVAEELRAAGQAGLLDLARDLEAGGQVAALAAMDVGEAFRHLFLQLRALQESMAPARCGDLPTDPRPGTQTMA
jgi:tRNA(Arg) A34 adenosine deaminase TadA